MALLALAVVGCVPDVDVRTAYDPQASFAAFKTYAMLLPNKAVPSKNTEVDPFVEQRLRQLTYLKLKELGLKPVAKDQADLVVGVIATRKQRVDVYPSTYYGFGYGVPYGYGYGYPYYGPGFGVGTSMWGSQAVRVNEGLVVIDLIDRKKQSVIWRGTGVSDLDSDFDDAKLAQIVAAILAESPMAHAP